MIIFAVVGELTGRVRLGGTKLPVTERCEQLQRECPDELTVLGASARHGPLERRIHAALARHRLRGDWYAREVADAIRAAGSGAHAFGTWLDALLGPRAAAPCMCGAAAASGGLTCGAAACVRRAKGRRTAPGLVIATAEAGACVVRDG